MLMPAAPRRRNSISMPSCSAVLRSRGGALVVMAALMPVIASASLAQTPVALPLEEVVVTARKREESALRTPVALSAFGREAIQSLRVRDLTRLSTGIPNVALDDVGTRRGTANFSIRGLGINSSIPSIDPTVGVFVNGVYLAVNNDTIFDVFDLDSIEVLRGPQGILFGRNVTGGAVLMQTRRPGKAFEADVRAVAEGGGDGGLNRYLMGSVGGSLSDNVQGRLSLYLNDDQGYFENRFDGADFGAIRQEMLRGTLSWQPDARSDITLFYEHMDIAGDGPASQAHRNGSGVPGSPENFRRDSLDFSIDGTGFQDVSSDFVTLQYDRTVDFGNGTITNIFGWRDQRSVGFSDIDAQPVFLFHSPGWVDASQWSNELRYAGRFGERIDATAGLYVFSGDLGYHDRRLFVGQADGSVQVTQDGGGLQELETLALFGAVDYQLSERWTLNLGLRFSREEKRVQVASFSRNVNAPCNVVLRNDCPFDFRDKVSFNTASPKLGVSHFIDDSSHLYAHWTRGFRSGGYNLRNSNAAEAPGPYGEEQVDSFEFGYKRGGSGWQLSTAAFFTRVNDMQREVNIASEAVGILQLIRNTATADLYGVEFDGSFTVSDRLQLRAALGYLNASYRSVRFDLNGDGVVDSADERLELPRAPEWTYNLGLDYSLPLGDAGDLYLRADYAYRDRAAYTDNNLGYILEQEILDLTLDYRRPGANWTVGLYGRNLLNSVKHGGDSQLPAQFFGQALGGTFAPLAKGRIVGAEVSYAF
jgi:iron complex outermembrane receptor protein